MRILAVDPDIAIRALYHAVLGKKNHMVVSMANVSYEFDAREYDVVIVHSEEVKLHMTNIPWNHLIVAGNQVSVKADGSWGITKPFIAAELMEILDVIADPSIPTNLKGEKFQ